MLPFGHRGRLTVDSSVSLIVYSKHITVSVGFRSYLSERFHISSTVVYFILHIHVLVLS